MSVTWREGNLSPLIVNETLAACLSEVTARVQHSLVSIRDGRRGMGAGVIWREDGLIITNHHVVAHRKPQVLLADGRELAAQVLALEEDFDLALLKIEAQNLPAALVGNSRGLRVGEFVLAVGHPWGQKGFVTGGLVSALSKAQSRGGRRVDIIRSDVGLAPGNSGGPLVNASGAVVGINTMIVGGDQGVAIPSHVAVSFVESVLRKNGSAGERWQ